MGVSDNNEKVACAYQDKCESLVFLKKKSYSRRR